MAGREPEGAVKPALTEVEKQSLRRQQLLRYQEKSAAMLRRRNLFTGLAIGTFVVGICILHRDLKMFGISKMHLGKSTVTLNLEKASVGIIDFKFS